MFSRCINFSNSVECAVGICFGNLALRASHQARVAKTAHVRASSLLKNNETRSLE